MNTLILVHVTTKEEREVDILGIWTTKVQIRWRGAGGGVYSLDLKKNILEGTRGRWTAKDIEAVKTYYRERRATQDGFKR